MKDNIVGPMMVHGYKIPASTVAKTLNWMASNNGFYFASVRDFLMSRGVEICVYETAERLIAKAKRDELIEFDKLHRVWRKVQK